jgi:hypothetical protein
MMSDAMMCVDESSLSIPQYAVVYGGLLEEEIILKTQRIESGPNNNHTARLLTLSIPRYYQHNPLAISRISTANPSFPLPLPSLTLSAYHHPNKKSQKHIIRALPGFELPTRISLLLQARCELRNIPRDLLHCKTQ